MSKWPKRPDIPKDRFYFCSICGIENNPFNYRGEEFEKQKKNNVCKRCLRDERKKEIFDRRTGEKTNEVRNDTEARQSSK